MDNMNNRIKVFKSSKVEELLLGKFLGEGYLPCPLKVIAFPSFSSGVYSFIIENIASRRKWFYCIFPSDIVNIFDFDSLPQVIYQASDIRKIFGMGKQIKIKIIKTPEGEAPEKIRKKWVGVVIKGAFLATEREVENPEEEMVAVPRKEALKALARVSPEAAKWFTENFPSSRNFVFNADEIKIVP